MFKLIFTFSRILLRSNLAIINWPEHTNWYTNSLSNSKICGVKSGALQSGKSIENKIQIWIFNANAVLFFFTHVKSLTTRTNSENDSLAAFCLI